MNVPYFLIPIVVGLVAQSLKPLFNRNRNLYVSMENMGGRALPRYGGMPSAHTAFAVSLVTVVGVGDWVSSITFTLASVLLILILDDALRMRMFLGRYGAALYRLIDRLPESEKEDFPYLEQRLGHRPAEVVVGALIGGLLTALILFFVA